MGFLEKFRGIFQVRETPHQIAMSFSVGVLMGISPLIGLHTIGAFFLAWLLGLNRFIAVAGVYVTNPWTIVPIYSFSLWVGAKIIGLQQILPNIAWNNVTPLYLFHEFSHLIWPFVFGSVIVGLIGSFISYCVIYILVLRYRKIRNAS